MSKFGFEGVKSFKIRSHYYFFSVNFENFGLIKQIFCLLLLVNSFSKVRHSYLL